MDLRKYIRMVLDFPKEGIAFQDISPLLADGAAWQYAIDALVEKAKEYNPTKLAGIDARGFLLAAPLAYKLGIGFAMIRKKGKLPWQTVEATYGLEYGQDCVEVQQNAFSPEDRVLICDDLLATGGTAEAAVSLVQACKASPIALFCLIELQALEGRKKLGELPVEALLTY